jgi:glycosyltransferase involved in cell wall biosynthesis
MRILYVVHGYVPEAVGGVELHAHYLATALASRHEVGVLAWRKDPEALDYDLEETRQDGVTVWRLNHTYRDRASFRGIYRNERIDELFDEIVGTWGPDLVHVHHLIGFSIGILERAKKRGLPLVLGLHDFWFGCPRGQRIRNPLVVCDTIDRRQCVRCLKPQFFEMRAPIRPLTEWFGRLRLPTRSRGVKLLTDYDEDMHRVLSLPDVVITPSLFHREMYVRYGLEKCNIRIIPYGLPKEAFTAGRRTEIAERAAARKDTMRIGFLGTLIPSKGAHVLLEAYRQLHRPEILLDFHGAWVPFHGDFGYLDRLKATAAAMRGNIRFHGRYEQAEVSKILQACDVLVVPSVWYESYSIVIREGFLAGVPVVASGHGAMKEAIEHEVSGMLFTPGDAADLARQLARVLDDPDLRQRIVAYPHDVSSVETNAAIHVDLYEGLLRPAAGG